MQRITELSAWLAQATHSHLILTSLQAHELTQEAMQRIAECNCCSLMMGPIMTGMTGGDSSTVLAFP